MGGVRPIGWARKVSGLYGLFAALRRNYADFGATDQASGAGAGRLFIYCGNYLIQIGFL
jgi:hypothetical protein